MGAGKESQQTKLRLQQCAVEEFMEKGFFKASLRTICRDAGVTTGALYFFFEDKDDLFVSLVKDLLQQIVHLMREHFAQEQSDATNINKNETAVDEDYSDDEKVSEQMIHILYAHRERTLLLLTCAQGSSVENAVDDLIQMVTEHYRMLADATAKRMGIEPLEESFVHWLSHMQIDTFIYMVTHIEEETEALRYIRQATHYMVNGWYGMFRSLE